MTKIFRILILTLLFYGCVGQGIMSISQVEEVTTEQELNQGTAFQGGDGGLTISVTGASFDTGMSNVVKQSIIDTMFTGTLDIGGTPELSTEPDGFNTHKISLVDTTTIVVTSTTTMVIRFNPVPEFDINVDEYLNITLPDSVLTAGSTVDLQPVPVRIQVSTGTIIIAKRPYEDPNGQATGHIMNEADARHDRPSLFIAVSPWENWKQLGGTPLGVSDMAPNCSFSNRPSEPFGWDSRVSLGNLLHTAHFTHTNGNYLRLPASSGLENWKYLEVFITPDPDFDISDTETISFNTKCVGPFLGSGIEPNPDSKLSFDIEPSSGTYYMLTSLGTDFWETDISLGLPCDWSGIGSSQIGNPIPNCNFFQSVNNPNFVAPDLTIQVILEKGETWLTDITAQNELISSFTSQLGSAFVANVDELLKDPASGNPRVTYIDEWTLEISVLRWPDWPLALRSSQGSFDITVDEYIELDLSSRTVASNNALYKPTKNPRGSPNPPGFTIKAAPGWFLPHGNTKACTGLTQAMCSGLCIWKDSYCVTTDQDVENLIFTETQLRLGLVVLEFRFASPPGFDPDTQADLGPNLYTPTVSSRTETWCSTTQPTGTVSSSANMCSKVLDGSDIRSSLVPTITTLTQGVPIPTYWESREASLIPDPSVTVTRELITIDLTADTLYEIWTDDTVLINIPPYTGDPPITQGVFTGSALVPVGQPANVTIVPDYGVLTVTHNTITHPPGFIDLTEDQVRAGAGSFTLRWEGEMWKLGCCDIELRGGGGEGRIPQGGLRLMSDVSITDNPFGWNNRIENATELLPPIQSVFSDLPFPSAQYSRTLTLNLQPDPFYDTTQEEHITITVTDDAVVSDLSYIGRGWPTPSSGLCPNTISGCSDFVINIKPSPGVVKCWGGASDGVCPDLTEEDIRTGGRVIYVELELGETWNDANYPAGFKTDLIGGLNSVVSATIEPLGWQANKGSIVDASSVNIDFSNSSRLLEITLLPFPNYDLVGVPFEEVRIDIFPRLTASGIGTNPSVLSFNILRSAGDIKLSACIGLSPTTGSPADPSPVFSPPEPASADCATGNEALITNVFIPDEGAYREAVVINEQDLIRGQVSLRIELQCGESWQTAAAVSPAVREVLMKSGFQNLNMDAFVLPSGTLSGNVFVPNSALCPQTATVMLSQYIGYNVDVDQIVKLQLPAALFSSGMTHRFPRYLIIRPVNGIADLNIRKDADDSNNVLVTAGGDLPINEQLIRDGGLQLRITYRPGEKFTQTAACGTDMLSMIRGVLNPNQDPSYAYKDPMAWGPGIDNVHTTVVPGSVVFESDTVAVITFNPFRGYDISVPQNVTLDIPGSCATSGLQPWWGDESRDTSEYVSQTISLSPNLREQVAGGSQYTWGYRGGIPKGAGLPGNGYFTIEPSPAMLLLEAVDGRGCSGACTESILPNRQNDIIIEDAEIRSTAQLKLRLTVIGDTWRVGTDSLAGVDCVSVPIHETCETVPVRNDVCGTGGGCICPGDVCCDYSDQKCGGSSQSPAPTDFNYKSLIWYFTFIPTEDWPKPVAANAGSNMPGLAAPLIAADLNDASGFSGRKDVVFPAPEISPTVTSVQMISPNVLELTLYQDPLFILKIDETAVIDLPGHMFRSGLDPETRGVNFTFAVTPPRVTLGPKNTFTESEIRAGVTLTLTLNTGCWVDNAMELLLPRMVSNQTQAQQPNGWESMVRGPVEQKVFVDGNQTILSPGPTCDSVLEIPINSTDYQVVWVGDAYDISSPEAVTISFSGDMIGSTISPQGDPVDPLVFTITPDSGGLEIYPVRVKEFDIRTCTQPIELTLRLFGERWPEPMTLAQQQCVFNSLTSITAMSEFNARKSDLIDVNSIQLKNPWEVSVFLECTPLYDSRDAELVFANVPGSCVVSGIPPGAAQGPDPARFQIEIEDGALVYLMNDQITEESLRTGTPCVDVVLISKDGTQNDTFVDDSVLIQQEMSSNQLSSVAPFGFNARKQNLLQPSDIKIVDQDTINPALNRPKLRFCFQNDPLYQIDSPELVTIIIRGSAVFSGIAPSYLNNIPLQFTIVPSPALVTVTPNVITEDDLRNGIDLKFKMDYGESWAFNPGSCFIGGANSRCDLVGGGVPQRSMCDCVANPNCEPGFQSVVSQPYGWNERFLNVVSSVGFVFESQDKTELTLKTTPDPLFDITQDQYIRVSILGCATASGIGSQDVYITIVKTPGKISVSAQEPLVGTTSPCSHVSCLHGAGLEFNERDVRNGSISLLLLMEGDLWINRPGDIMNAFISDCPTTPGTGLPSRFCVAGFDSKRTDIIPTTAFTIVLNSDERLLNVSFTEVPTYNIDFSEQMCYLPGNGHRIRNDASHECESRCTVWSNNFLFCYQPSPW
eukprot:TRINITY_DN2561_c2_g3_i3.p1 TRINITY_DN2561_c2_g3~~TRINITY_DN2561_c2_g3_i3.p1  ORF type:complete len:2373 (+),score=389.83 TRINITY_DN2561_c2_g3_i3:161-7279(+)